MSTNEISALIDLITKLRKQGNEPIGNEKTINETAKNIFKQSSN